MTLYITGGSLDEYRPGAPTPTYEIAGENILSFDVEQKVGDLKDIAKLAIDNTNDEYTTTIDHGDRIDLTIRGQALAGEPGYGVGGYGEGPYGGAKGELVWTGIVRDYDIQYHGAGQSVIQIDAEDFVSAIMGFRNIYNEWRNRQIVGSNGIVNEILADRCPEIDLSLLPDRSERTSISSFGETALAVVYELALRTPALVSSVDTRIRFDHPSSLHPRFTLERADYDVLKVGSQDTNMRNYVRVRGGTDDALDDEQLVHDGSITVTDSQFATARIRTRKSMVSEIEVFTLADRTGGDIVVRLQKDDGGAPIAPNDDKSDITRRRLSAEFLDDNGYTSFLLPDHTLPEPSPWVIVQGDESGQQIGVDAATGTPAYRAYYPYPIVIVKENADSIEQYRRRDGQINKGSISTFADANARGSSYLREHGQPTQTLQFSAESARMHEHEVGTSIQLDTVAASGAFVCMEKKAHYEANQLTTDFSFQALDSI